MSLPPNIQTKYRSLIAEAGSLNTRVNATLQANSLPIPGQAGRSGLDGFIGPQGRIGDIGSKD